MQLTPDIMHSDTLTTSPPRKKIVSTLFGKTNFGNPGDATTHCIMVTPLKPSSQRPTYNYAVSPCPSS